MLDTIVTSLKDRFNQSSFVVYENIESLLLKTIRGAHVITFTAHNSDALTRQSSFDNRAIVFHCKKNKNLDAFQNDLSEIQCVVNFAYT